MRQELSNSKYLDTATELSYIYIWRSTDLYLDNIYIGYQQPTLDIGMFNFTFNTFLNRMISMQLQENLMLLDPPPPPPNSYGAQ